MKLFDDRFAFNTLYKTASLEVVALVLLTVSTITQAQSTENRSSGKFSGAYLGFELSRQNVIAGALLNGVDTLAQDTRMVRTINAGYRFKFGDAFLLGIETGWSYRNKDLSLKDPTTSLHIDYDNDSQWHLGATAGFVLGEQRQTLVYVYASEVTREFSVTINLAGTVFHQQDEQGMLRYGIGVERGLGRHWSLRTSLGSSVTDFGNKSLNLKPDRPIEVAIGLNFLF